MTDRQARRGRDAVVVMVVVGALALLGALVLHLTASNAMSHPSAAPVVDRGTLPTGDAATTAPAGGATPTASAGGDPATTAGTSPPVRHDLPAGARLRYTRLGIDAPIVHVSVTDGVMDVPRDPHTLGWWSGGAAPGDPAGTAVVVGHINYAGTSGALAVLPRAQPGDRVTVVEAGTDRRYRVTAVRTYSKSRGIPAAAFARTGRAQLVLITCGGPFDESTGNYEDNIVVYADPA